MDVALFDPDIAALAALGAVDVADAGRQRLEDRVEALDHRLVAADHHAIAAVDAPDAAGSAGIDIMDAARLQRLAAAHVLLPERVAAVDNYVVLAHQFCERLDGGLGDLAGRQHHPGGARLFEFFHEILERIGPDRAFGS